MATVTTASLNMEPPSIKITTKAGKVSNSVATISGTATAKVGLSSVWYEVGTGGWALAASTDGYSNWTAVVILSPGANTIQVYAEDAAGHLSKTNTVTLTDSSTGFAPESLDGTTLLLVNGDSSALLSFDGSTFTQAGNGGVTSGVGVYTYALTNANIALLSPNFTSPPAVTNSVTEGIILTFTNVTGGTFAKNNGETGGSFTLGVALSAAPVLLSGLTLQGANNEGGVYEFTNAFGDGTITSTDTDGKSSGTYTFAQYSPDGALLLESFTNGPEMGATNYVVLNFSTATNSYYWESDTPTGLSTFSGTFSLSGKESTEGYTAPASLDGMSAAVTKVRTDGKRKSFILSFGADTFCQFTTDTNDHSGVGTYTLTRTGPKTSLLALTFLAPPNAVSAGGGEVPLYFTTGRTANSTNSDGRATITFSSATSTVPLSLVGRKLTGKSSEGGGSLSFGFGTFTSSGNGGSGTYTYVPYGPQMALVTRYYTDPSDSGTVSYLVLYFSSPASGYYVKTDNSGGINSGTFTME